MLVFLPTCAFPKVCILFVLAITLSSFQRAIGPREDSPTASGACQLSRPLTVTAERPTILVSGHKKCRPTGGTHVNSYISVATSTCAIRTEAKAFEKSYCGALSPLPSSCKQGEYYHRVIAVSNIFFRYFFPGNRGCTRKAKKPQFSQTYASLIAVLRRHSE